MSFSSEAAKGFVVPRFNTHMLYFLSSRDLKLSSHILRVACDPHCPDVRIRRFDMQSSIYIRVEPGLTVKSLK